MLHPNDVLPHVVAAVNRKSRLFNGLRRQLGRDDLISEAILIVLQLSAQYDRKRPLGPWVRSVLDRRLIDVYRREMRYFKKNEAYHQANSRIPPVTLPGEIETYLVEWLTDQYAEIKSRMNESRQSRQSRRGRPEGRNPVYTRAQRLALLLLQRRTGLGMNGVHRLLRSNPKLCAAIEIDHPPARVLLHVLHRTRLDAIKNGPARWWPIRRRIRNYMRPASLAAVLQWRETFIPACA